MNFLKHSIDFIIHIDKYLDTIISNYGTATYVILFLIILCETGLVVTPFLPGDSLIFAAGAFSSIGSLNIYLVALILSIAAILGDTINYHIGKYIGPKIIKKENLKLINKANIEKTHKFYEKHGGKTIIIARFIPIIRTFAPFVAGIGDMNYLRFLSYNAIGGLLWVNLFAFGGYIFGNLPTVKDNFTIVIFMIIFISILPAIIGVLKNKFKKN